MSEILERTENGLYCPAGDFYVDPVRPVPRAVVTHAHSDHARWGCEHYLATRDSEHLLRMRMSAEADFDFLPYGQTITHRGVRIEFHPAGHILGSAQVRIEVGGRIAVVAGDYKLGADATCRAWEPVRCHLFVTESTFALPVYRWPDQQSVFAAINQWWRENAAAGKCSVIYGYAVGKSQRLIAGLNSDIGPIYTHGAVEKGVQAYRATGVQLPPTTYVGGLDKKHAWAGGIVVAVPAAHGTPWLRRFGTISTAMASGWMMIRGTRRRRATDRGFVLSDHVDWPTLLRAIDHCDPERVWVQHGYSEVAARYLRSHGRDAVAIDRSGRRGDDDEADGNVDGQHDDGQHDDGQHDDGGTAEETAT